MSRIWLLVTLFAALALAGLAAAVLTRPAPEAAPAAQAAASTATPASGPAFPRPLLFRTSVEQFGLRGMPVEALLTIAAPYDLVIAKALDEEVPDLQKAAPYLQAIKKRYPDKIVLDHFLLQGRHPTAAYPPVWPGHWLLLNGSTLAAPLGDAATDTILTLAPGTVARVGDDLQVTALDAAGRLDYTRVEQMRVEAVTGVRVTVRRAMHGSSRLRFEANRARVAAHAKVTYSDNVGAMWDYNFCREAPLDPNGRRFIDNLAQSLADYLKPGAILGGLDGYQFDVARFAPPIAEQQATRRLDCDNDNAPDAGYVQGMNSYGLGMTEFTQRLRTLVGDRTLLLSEATGYWSARDITYANGIENESFPELRRWHMFSSAYERYQFWRDHARPPRLSYLQLKETTEVFTRCPQEDAGMNWKARLAHGAALLGDGYFAHLAVNQAGSPQCGWVDPTRELRPPEADELFAGAEKRWHYLGHPRGDAQRIDLIGAAPDLITDGGFEAAAITAAIVGTPRAGAAVTRDTTNPAEGAAALRIDLPAVLPDPQDTHFQVRLAQFRAERGREYTLRFRVRADGGYAKIDPLFADVPVRVTFNLTTGTEAPAEQDATAAREWRAYSLSFVAAADDPQATLVMVAGREQGAIWLDSLHLYAGPGDTFVRRFDGGVVLVNGSITPATFDLDALFPGLSLRRIQGPQDPRVNTGEPARGRLTVPARDSLILLAR